MNKKKVILDFLYNIIASFLVTGVMQILLFPFFASKIGTESYGFFLTVISVINTLSAMVGSTLNNVRLIQNNLYVKMKEKGDFKLILYCSNIINSIVFFIINITFFHMDLYNLILCCILIVLQSLRNYYIVIYRIKLNFKYNLLANIFVAIGYTIGIPIFYIVSLWVIPLIIGELFCLFFIKYTSRIMKEPFTTTSLFSQTFWKYLGLGISTIMGNLLLYLDRLLLYPLLGASSVAVYTVASTVGKLFGLVTSPISGVLLGYYTQGNFKLTRTNFWRINVFSFLIGILVLLLSIVIAPAFTKVFYSNMYKEAIEIMVYANIASILIALSNTIQPAVLKLVPMKWQVLKEILYGSIYIMLGLFMLTNYGLIGFCLANIISNLIRIIILLILGTYYSEV